MDMIKWMGMRKGKMSNKKKKTKNNDGLEMKSQKSTMGSRFRVRLDIPEIATDLNSLSLMSIGFIRTFEYFG